ncbi:MAG: hypothetical protein LBH17_03165, partial [Oscillospiraceae bacterium]|nr:hypothetical protein [Oscillospiraceae bacterium]
MKSKLITLALTLALLLTAAACGAAPQQPADTDAPPVSAGEPTPEGAADAVGLTLSESWDFDSGFYPIGSPETQSDYGPMFWSLNFYDTLVRFEDGEFLPS